MSQYAVDLDIALPRWAVPLEDPSRYKGAKGGRSSGKSHYFAEKLVEKFVEDPDLQWVCIREVQKSLRFSAKKLIENKIRKLKVEHLFEITREEIRRKGGRGIMIFQGMQDHTADSIKSLEDFDGCWAEEAQSLSARSLELLIPTIRKEGSELWFSWNPNQPEDAIEELLVHNPPETAIVVHVNYTDNPWCPKVMKEQAEWQRRVDPERYDHIWLGGYNTKSDAQVFREHWVIDDFEPQEHWDGPYFGSDWGFSTDPTTLVKTWVDSDANRLYIEYEVYEVGLKIIDTGDKFRTIPGASNHTIRADNARPETISAVNDQGLWVVGASKWQKSVEEGIEFLLSFDKIVIHERCVHAQEEARLYSYKVDKLSGDIMPVVVDKNNHIWDAVRYGLAPIIQSAKVKVGVMVRSKHKAGRRTA